MVSVGFISALITGMVGYFGGAATRWIGVQTIHLGTAIANSLLKMGLIGRGVAWAVGILPFLIIGCIGVFYPVLIGSIAGTAVAVGAKEGKCRMPKLAGLVGLLSGGVAYATLIATSLLMKAPLQVSSRILGVIDPPLIYVLMVVDGLIVLVAATSYAGKLYKTPFCESCGLWYGSPKTLTIPISGAAMLVEALDSRSVLPLRVVTAGTPDLARIQLELSRCACDQSDYNLVAILRWEETRKGKDGKESIKSNTQNWFKTTLTASLGAEIESWATQALSDESRCIEATKNDIRDSQVTTTKADSPVISGVLNSSDLIIKQPMEKTEICKRCGSTIDKSKNTSVTCPDCGFTQWGMIIGTGIFSLLCLGAALLWSPHIAGSFLRSIVLWGGGIIGAVVLLVTISWTVKGLRTPTKPLP